MSVRLDVGGMLSRGGYENWSCKRDVGLGGVVGQSERVGRLQVEMVGVTTFLA